MHPSLQAYHSMVFFLHLTSLLVIFQSQFLTSKTNTADDWFGPQSGVNLQSKVTFKSRYYSFSRYLLLFFAGEPMN